MKTQKWIVIGMVALTLMFVLLSFCSCDDITTTAIVTTLTAQKPEPTYEIKENGEEQYIVIHNLNAEMPSGGVIPNYLIFDSFAQMKDTVKNHKFTRQDLETMQLLFHKNADGTIPICRVDTMQMPILPRGALPSYPVLWYGERYELPGSIPEYGKKASVFFVYHTKDSYQKAYENYYEDADDERYTVRELKDRDAVELVYQNSKTIQYSFTANDTIYQVQESYTRYQDADDILTNVRVFCHKGNNYYVLHFYDLEKIPSAEWLSLFDIQSIPDLVIE